MGQTLNAMAGGARDRVDTYASGALMRQHPLDYLAQAGPRLVGMGFKQMKMQCGSEPTVGASVERVRVMRESIGEDVDLMCDINQLWSVPHAVEVGKRIEPYHLFWLEDPVAHDDYPGLARVADALVTPIAAGEYHYGIVPFRHLLEARSIDIVMIDLLRVGGITQWLKVAGMAEAFNLPVVSHLIPEIHVHLMAAIPNGLTVEYMPWTQRLFEEYPAIEDGQLVVPTKPGLGLEFNRKPRSSSIRSPERWSWATMWLVEGATTPHMPITLNHTIVPSRDKDGSARFFARIFGLSARRAKWPLRPGPRQRRPQFRLGYARRLRVAPLRVRGD